MSLPNPLPNGSYQQSCQQCTVTRSYTGISVLNCNCKKLDNSLQNTSLAYPTVETPILDVANINGSLVNVNNPCPSPYQRICNQVCNPCGCYQRNCKHSYKRPCKRQESSSTSQCPLYRN